MPEPSPDPTPGHSSAHSPTPPAGEPDPAGEETPPPTAALDIELRDDGDDGTGSGGRIGTVSVSVRNTDQGPITATLRVSLPGGMSFDTSRGVVADPIWACQAPVGTQRSCIAEGLAPGAAVEVAIPVAIAADDLDARPVANLSIRR